MDQIYTPDQIQEDINFLRAEFADSKASARPGSGVTQVIELAQSALLAKEFSEEQRRAIHTLNAIISSLKILKARGIPYYHQLKNMRRGDLNFGKSNRDERWFKDYEFEIVSAAQLSTALPGVSLSLDDSGNDIFFSNIEIQCKHPDSLDIQRRQSDISKFNLSLRAANKYGVFGLAVEDLFDLHRGSTSLGDHPTFASFIQSKRAEIEATLMSILFPFICTQERIMGVYTSSSYFGWLEPTDTQMRFRRDFNGTLINRPTSNISPEDQNSVLNVVSYFNPNFVTVRC